MRSAAAIPEVREVVDAVREATAGGSSRDRAARPRPRLRTAVRGWLWFMDGAILDWIEHGDIERKKLRGLLLGTSSAR